MSDTKFKPGDRVRLSSAATEDRRKAVEDRQGTVRYDSLPEPGRVYVYWDRGDLGAWNYPHANEIEHVPELPATYAEQAAALREQAALIRNERDEKFAEADRLTEEADALDTRANSLTAAAIALEKIK